MDPIREIEIASVKEELNEIREQQTWLAVRRGALQQASVMLGTGVPVPEVRAFLRRFDSKQRARVDFSRSHLTRSAER